MSALTVAACERASALDVGRNGAGLTRAERVRRLGEDLDALYADVVARMGEADVAHHARVRRFSLAMQVLGRAAIHFSFEPVTFVLGVLALAVHKQLQWETGHTALHGAYDRLPNAPHLASRTVRWDLPIDEASWRRGHNAEHHAGTNVVERDPDVTFCGMRFAEHVPWRPRHRFQIPILFGLVAPVFAFVMNVHLTGAKRWKDGARKTVPYVLWNYVFFPALAGVHWAKVLLGNAIAEMLRDVYSAFTFMGGHTGERERSWPEGTRAHGRAEWYAMQIEASTNFEVPLALSLLCGGVDRHIEHHVFPRLPPNRLREIAPRVRAICERHGFEYRTAAWPRIIAKAMRRLYRLSSP
jgi:linoleoyl-CoA desaturase